MLTGGKSPREHLLSQAIDITKEDRNTQYGDPEDNFRNIAEYWTIYLSQRFETAILVEPHDVALLMDLMKTARILHNPSHYDSWLDKAGYTACGWQCIENKEDDHH